VGTGTGEQIGPVGQGPRELGALPGPRRGRDHRSVDDVGWQRGVDPADDLDDDGHRVSPVFGFAPDASGPAVPVPDVHRPGLAAGRAGFPPRPAAPAVPVLAAALQGAQRLATLRADRRGDSHRAGGAQRDQQVPNHARGR
jgi:hypothetical protein